MNVLAEQWQQIQQLADQVIIIEPSLKPFLTQCVVEHDCFEASLACILSKEITSPQLQGKPLFDLIKAELCENSEIVTAVSNDMYACVTRDPACIDILTCYLYFKGFHALQLYRVAHSLWQKGRTSIALYLQSRASQEFDVDIHPAAVIGSGIMIDHATGVVIGETAIVENNVSILHGVTLGGNGLGSEKRHPTIRSGVLISTGAKILGNVEIGEGAKIAASSLILESVEPYTTMAGVPAKMVNRSEPNPDIMPSIEMHHEIDRFGNI